MAQDTFQILLDLTERIRRDNEQRHVLSTGEYLAVALLLNRSDWLDEKSYTMVEAIDHIGPQWLAELRDVERVLQNS